jgi:hypothetical protein
MATTIHASASSIESEAPVALFQPRMDSNVVREQYSVSADGRFLINEIIDDSSAPPITLILNWKSKP